MAHSEGRTNNVDITCVFYTYSDVIHRYMFYLPVIYGAHVFVHADFLADADNDGNLAH